MATKEKCNIRCPTEEIDGIWMLDATNILVAAASENRDCFAIKLPEKSVQRATPRKDGANLAIITNLSSYSETYVQRGKILTP